MGRDEDYFVPGSVSRCLRFVQCWSGPVLGKFWYHRSSSLSAGVIGRAVPLLPDYTSDRNRRSIFVSRIFSFPKSGMEFSYHSEYNFFPVSLLIGGSRWCAK